MPRQEDVFVQINTSVTLTRPQIATAKQYILASLKNRESVSATTLLHNFLSSVEALQPEIVILHEGVDSSNSINKAIKYISWSLAFSESIWSLIHNNALAIISESISITEPHIPWTTVYQHSGGTNSGWDFPQWKFSIPNNVIISPSISTNKEDYLIEPDLFINNLNIENMTKEVKDALVDAILCFRADLYTPCLVMLIKAVEIAWVDLGLGLLNTLDDSQQEQLKTQYEILSDGNSSVAKIIRTVLEIYNKPELYKDLYKESNINIKVLRFAALWVDVVRESRNVVHYRNVPILPNNFEKVATLLLGAPSHFKTVYALLEKCKKSGQH